MHREAEWRRLVEDDLRDALVRDEISLVYQPQVDAQTNQVVGLEALIRWNHPRQGLISPSFFIPVAEQTGLIADLGNWALQRACLDAVHWPKHVRVAVNVSQLQFTTPTLPRIVMQALTESGLSPERLELELTESIFLGATDATDAMFRSLKSIGVRLALDDFGTGYSSLGYLQNAPFDKIKIDQCFVRGVTDSESRSAAIIQAIVSLAEAVDMDTVAEGVEAHDELDRITSLNVRNIQGYIYSKPVPACEVDAAFQAGEWHILASGPQRYRTERRKVLRKVGLIHDGHRYDLMMRNISRTGCRVDGLLDVPIGTEFVVDFGEGQLVNACVRRSAKSVMGLQFEQSLIQDGAGGFTTRNRVYAYTLAAAGLLEGTVSEDMCMVTPRMLRALNCDIRALLGDASIDEVAMPERSAGDIKAGRAA